MINIKCKKIVLMVAFVFATTTNSYTLEAQIVDNNTSKKCASIECTNIKNDMLLIMEEKLNQLSDELKKHDINKTIIKNKLRVVIDNVSEVANDSTCMKIMKSIFNDVKIDKNQNAQ